MATHAPRAIHIGAYRRKTDAKWPPYGGDSRCPHSLAHKIWAHGHKKSIPKAVFLLFFPYICNRIVTLDTNYMTTSAYLLIFCKILGSLALLIYGMKIMSEALQKMAGSQLRHILAAMTTNRFTGMLTGTFITFAVQS